MSIHKSLAVKSSLVRSRNVLTRYERILQLKKSGKWAEDASPFGIQKVRVLKVKKRGKEKKKKEEGEAAAAPGAAAAAAPAAGGKAAAPAAAAKGGAAKK